MKGFLNPCVNKSSEIQHITRDFKLMRQHEVFYTLSRLKSKDWNKKWILEIDFLPWFTRKARFLLSFRQKPNSIKWISHSKLIRINVFSSFLSLPFSLSLAKFSFFEKKTFPFPLRLDTDVSQIKNDPHNGRIVMYLGNIWFMGTERKCGRKWSLFIYF